VIDQVETTVQKNESDQTMMVKSKPVNNQSDVDPKNLSSNFLFVYKSVTAVLREHGLI
jgi:hypothetical protein